MASPGTHHRPLPPPLYPVPGFLSFKMPTLDVSELNTTISILGAFILLFGLVSIKVKRAWYLGEARMSQTTKLPPGVWQQRDDGKINITIGIVPAVIIVICLGPIAAKFIDTERWGSAEPGQTSDITLVRNDTGTASMMDLDPLDMLTINAGRHASGDWHPGPYGGLPASSEVPAA